MSFGRVAAMWMALSSLIYYMDKHDFIGSIVFLLVALIFLLADYLDSRPDSR